MAHPDRRSGAAAAATTGPEGRDHIMTCSGLHLAALVATGQPGGIVSPALPTEVFGGPR
jgi:hypothetical protein